ncbi:MAG: lipase family protein [Siphonobacter sp.]
MKHFLLRSGFFLSILIIYLVSCKGSEPSSEEADKYLVEATSVGTFTKDQVVSQLSSIYGALVQYGVKTYRITYNTTNTDGTTIQASGALIIPAIESAVPMVSYQHGTISSDSQAPSYFGTTTDSQFITMMASLGYVIVAPDYIGYGASNAYPHPYEHRSSLAQASLDLLRAAKEYFKKNNTSSWDGRLYLTGYSEGGYATMSLYKKMQDETSSEFNLRAVSVGSGAYNKTAFMNYLVNTSTGTTVEYNRLYAWVLTTYNRVYELNRSMSYYFKEPYASQIEANVSTASLGVSFNTIFTDSFKTALNDGTDTAFINAVKDNDVYDWKPNTTLWMYHGTADDLVPYFNSETAYEAMVAQGSTVVTFFPQTGLDHSTNITPYALGTLNMVSSVE